MIDKEIDHRLRGQRIFWLGMHHVLKNTELLALRKMGCEVFSPAYISPIFDQSADTTIDHDQPSTLPVDVFEKLIKHDFFYTAVPDEIAEILNTYFDTVIVTIHADWLASIIRCYHGRVIYRVYGQPWSLSEQIISNGLWRKLIDRADFSIVPFARESVEQEYPWFLDRCSDFVPYQIPDEVFAYSDSWCSSRYRMEISVSIPNIENPYYAQAYSDFRVYPEKYFRIFGPQRSTPPDPRILGKLDRSYFLKRLSQTAGYFYPYADRVCYLPPIEMMEIGGPVIYVGGSLLARFGDSASPALARSIEDAKAKLHRLLDGDKVFAREVIAAQEPIRQRYDRAFVQPIFDATFRRLLDPSMPMVERTAPIAVRAARGDGIDGVRSIVIPLHHSGLFSYVEGRPTAVEGIPRVIDAVVGTILAASDARIILSCLAQDEPITRDFFAAGLRDGRISVEVLEVDADKAEAGRGLARLAFVDFINGLNPKWTTVFIPHYYLFPELLLLACPSVMYLPDYFPHILPDQTFDVSREKDALNKRVGVGLARGARCILTNSQYTKDYLAAAGFVAEDELDKVIVAPLPLLGQSRASSLDDRESENLRRHIGTSPFLFYPTANRPNKQLSFLLRLFAHLRMTVADLRLVLTCDLGSVLDVRKTAQDYDLLDHIVLLPGSSDSRMRWLYENTAALCLTSVAEGNFPPQILEAIAYRAPVVATRLPTIVEVAGSEIERLLVCEPLNLAEFADALLAAFERREAILANQEILAKHIGQWNSPEAFAARITVALDIASPSRGVSVGTAPAP